MPAPSVEGVRLLVVDTAGELEPAERDLHCALADGYQLLAPPVPLPDGRVLFALTLVEWG